MFLKDVIGETISTFKRFPHTSDEETRMKMMQLQLQSNQRFFLNVESNNKRTVNEMKLQIEQQKEKYETDINGLKAEINELKRDLPKLCAKQNTLQHQCKNEKKDNEQRLKNISAQLENNDTQLKKISTQLSQLNTHTDTEINTVHSTIESVKQAQAVLASGLKQTGDSVDNVKSEMMSHFKEATSKLSEGQSKLGQDIQNMFVNQQAYFQNMFAQMNIEKNTNKKEKNKKQLSHKWEV